jgi:hypothetical protein
MPRAERGIGALTIAVDGHWNSRMAGSVGSFGSDRGRTNASMFDAALVMAWPSAPMSGECLCASFAALELLSSSFECLFALDQSWSDGRRTGAVGGKMAVLLGPELAIDQAAVEQHLVRRNVDQIALLDHQDLVALDQR